MTDDTLPTPGGVSSTRQVVSSGGSTSLATIVEPQHVTVISVVHAERRELCSSDLPGSAMVGRHLLGDAICLRSRKSRTIRIAPVAKVPTAIAQVMIDTPEMSQSSDPEHRHAIHALIAAMNSGRLIGADRGLIRIGTLSGAK